ncbi:hypothetical protein Bca4012_049284 [Brassica carinata]
MFPLLLSLSPAPLIPSPRSRFGSNSLKLSIFDKTAPSEMSYLLELDQSCLIRDRELTSCVGLDVVTW